MLISVVIPCYNAERTIGAAIESALGQEAEHEIIVVDDGSTDGSAGIIHSFGGRIRAEFGPNSGVSAARNRGTRIALGDLVQYLDSDDLLAPGTLAKRRDALVTNGADAAYTDYQRIFETSDGLEQPDKIVSPSPGLLAEDAEAACADSRFWVPPAAILYRRSIVDRVGGFRTEFPVVEDARFLFDAAAQGAKFAYVPGVGAFYRVRQNSLSQQSRSRFVHYCFMNAAAIEASWRARNVLSRNRSEVLRSLWWQSAVWSLLDSSPDFETARRHHNRLAKRRAALEVAWLLRRIVGPQVAGFFARTRLRWHAALRNS